MLLVSVDPNYILYIFYCFPSILDFFHLLGWNFEFYFTQSADFVSLFLNKSSLLSSRLVLIFIWVFSKTQTLYLKICSTVALIGILLVMLLVIYRSDLVPFNSQFVHKIKAHTMICCQIRSDQDSSFLVFTKKILFNYASFLYKDLVFVSLDMAIG